MNDSFPTDERTQRVEQIVAYLDGELSPEECAEVEHRLASDEGFRQELQSIERTWLVLDELPHTTVDDNFSRTTMEMVVQAAGAEVEQMTQALPLQRRRRKLSKALLALGAALMGLLFGKLLWVDPNQDLIEDLPAIQYVDLYSQVPDIDFLRQLDGMLSEDALNVNAEQTEQKRNQYRLVSSEDSRESWLDSLGQEQQLTLRAKLNRYHAMSSQQQQRIRDLHAAIIEAEDSITLQRVLLLYEQWLQGVTSSEQYELRQMQPQQRLRSIESAIEEEHRKRMLELSEEELKNLHEAVISYRNAIIESAMRSMDARERREFARQPSIRRISQVFRNAPRELMEDLIEGAQDSLPPEKREVYRKLSRPAQIMHLMQWMMQAEPNRNRQGRHNRRKKPSDQELEKFFVESVEPQMYERLMAMPRDKMERELEKMYSGGLSSNDWSTLREMGWREMPARGNRRFDGPLGEKPFGPGERLRGRQDGEGPGPGGPGFRRERQPRGNRPFSGERRPRMQSPRGEESGGFRPGPPPRDESTPDTE